MSRSDVLLIVADQMRVDESLREQEIRTERGVNYVRAAVCILGIVLDVYTAIRTDLLGARYLGLIVPFTVIVLVYLTVIHA